MYSYTWEVFTALLDRCMIVALCVSRGSLTTNSEAVTREI
jgi:hypothetical protein